MYTVKSLSSAVELTSEDGTRTCRIDFSDRRIYTRLVKWIKHWRDMGKEIDEKLEEVTKIEDEIDRLCAGVEIELAALEDFRTETNGVFGCDIVGLVFGDILPDLGRYAELFNILLPYIKEANIAAEARAAQLMQKYQLPDVGGLQEA